MHILLVEDDETQARAIRKRLDDMSWELHVALDAEGAREVIEHTNVDVVLLDLELPDTHGLQLLEEIRTRHPGLPVVILTATGTPETAYRALSHGAVDYLVKGTEALASLPDRLEHAVDAWSGIDHLGREQGTNTVVRENRLPERAQAAIEDLAGTYVDEGTATGLLICSNGGVVLSSHLPRDLDVRLLASRIAAQAHQAQRTSQAAGLSPSCHALLARNEEGVLAVATGPPGVLVALLLPTGTSTVAALRRIQEATRVLTERFEET